MSDVDNNTNASENASQNATNRSTESATVQNADSLPVYYATDDFPEPSKRRTTRGLRDRLIKIIERDTSKWPYSKKFHKTTANIDTMIKAIVTGRYEKTPEEIAATGARPAVGPPRIGTSKAPATRTTFGQKEAAVRLAEQNDTVRSTKLATRLQLEQRGFAIPPVSSQASGGNTGGSTEPPAGVAPLTNDGAVTAVEVGVPEEGEGRVGDDHREDGVVNPQSSSATSQHTPAAVNSTQSNLHSCSPGNHGLSDIEAMNGQPPSPGSSTLLTHSEVSAPIGISGPTASTGETTQHEAGPPGSVSLLDNELNVNVMLDHDVSGLSQMNLANDPIENLLKNVKIFITDQRVTPPSRTVTDIRLLNGETSTTSGSWIGANELMFELMAGVNIGFPAKLTVTGASFPIDLAIIDEHGIQRIEPVNIDLTSESTLSLVISEVPSVLKRFANLNDDNDFERSKRVKIDTKLTAPPSDGYNTYVPKEITAIPTPTMPAIPETVPAFTAIPEAPNALPHNHQVAGTLVAPLLVDRDADIVRHLLGIADLDPRFEAFVDSKHKAQSVPETLNGYRFATEFKKTWCSKPTTDIVMPGRPVPTAAMYIIRAHHIQDALHRKDTWFTRAERTLRLAGELGRGKTYEDLDAIALLETEATETVRVTELYNKLLEIGTRKNLYFCLKWKAATT